MGSVDGVVLGVGAPNRTKEGRVVQCAIVLCREKGLCRIYGDFKTQMKGLRLWDVIGCSVYTHSGDNRPESWRVEDQIFIEGRWNSRDFRSALLNSCCISDVEEDPIDRLNRERRSIAVIKVKSSEVGYRMESRVPEKQQDWVKTQRESIRKPYISWTSQTGKQHTNQLCAHEAYEYLRKNENATGRLWENLRIEDDEYQKWLLLGNTKDHRNIWVVVHVHRLKKDFNESLGGNLWFGETTASWPYLPSQELREKRVASNGQGMLFSH